MNSLQRKSLAVLFGGMVFAMAASSSFAQNTRPVTVNNGDGPGMQSIIDDVLGAGSGVTVNDQSSASLWAVDNIVAGAGFPTNVSPTLRLEYAGDASTNQLGIWSAGSQQLIFNGSATSGSIANIRWDTLTTGEILSGGGTGIVTGTFSGISATSFGFFLNGASGAIFSDDSKNGGEALMLAYASNSAPNDWMFAFEDTKGGDRDFNDMVFRVSDLVSAVPEPETYAMLLAGLGLMGFVARRRQRNMRLAAA